LIDPVLVQTDKINAILQKRGKQLKYILLTHIPTSYISGYLEFTNVDVVFGPGVEAAQGLRNLKENETINIGDLTISYATTGHFSTECVCFIVSNKGG
jgi:glyoxylase-like metal-dependent hydrolase (beta-lactamase superfamily II)